MEKIQGKMAHEVSKIEERKAKIDDELKEVQVCFGILFKISNFYVIVKLCVLIMINPFSRWWMKKNEQWAT